jgi:hypothetical protein
MTPKEKALQIISNINDEIDGIAAYDYSNVNKSLAFYIADELLRCTQGAIYYKNVKNEMELYFKNNE